jgi:hypothetical protein
MADTTPTTKKTSGCLKKGLYVAGGGTALLIILMIALWPSDEEMAEARRANDSALAVKQKFDSISHANRAKYVVDSAKAAQKKEEDLAKKREAIAREWQSTQRKETYNGHEVHVGPKGGRYYIGPSGKPVYLDK